MGSSDALKAYSGEPTKSTSPSDVLEALADAAGLTGSSAPLSRLYAYRGRTSDEAPSWRPQDVETPWNFLWAAKYAALDGAPQPCGERLFVHAIGASYQPAAKVRLIGLDVDDGELLSAVVRSVRRRFGVEPVVSSGSGRPKSGGALGYWVRFTLTEPAHVYDIQAALRRALFLDGVPVQKGVVEVYPARRNGRLPGGLGGCLRYALEENGTLRAPEHLHPLDIIAATLEAEAPIARFRDILERIDAPEQLGLFAPPAEEPPSPARPKAKRGPRPHSQRSQRSSRSAGATWERMRTALSSPTAPGQRERPATGRFSARYMARRLPAAKRGERTATTECAYGACRRAGLSPQDAGEAIRLWVEDGALEDTRWQEETGEDPTKRRDWLDKDLPRWLAILEEGYEPVRTKRVALANPTKKEAKNLVRLARRAHDALGGRFEPFLAMVLELFSRQKAAELEAEARGAKSRPTPATRMRAKKYAAEDPNPGYQELAGGRNDYPKMREALHIRRVSGFCKGIAAAGYRLEVDRDREGEPLLLGERHQDRERHEELADLLDLDLDTGASTATPRPDWALQRQGEALNTSECPSPRLHASARARGEAPSVTLGELEERGPPRGLSPPEARE